MIVEVLKMYTQCSHYVPNFKILSKMYHITICKIISHYITLGILICDDTAWYHL